MPSIDFVVPLFNEHDSLPRFHKLLEETRLPDAYSRRYIYINDGSTDQTPAVLKELEAAEPRVTVIHLSRNFGHQAALSAGLDATTADVVISMDGDGQHPPALVAEMLRLYESGYD